MRRRDLQDSKSLNIEELKKKSNEIKKEILDLKMDKSMGNLKDLKVISKKRKDLAQILTILRQKELVLELEEIKKGVNQ